MEYNKPRIVLKTLMNGLPVEYNGQTYYMSEDYEICMEMDRFRNGEFIGKYYAPIDTSIGSFIKWTNKFTNDDIALLAANLTLNNID